MAVLQNMWLRLWFGDERGYNATNAWNLNLNNGLWFGDERGYNATLVLAIHTKAVLWFGDERGYNATHYPNFMFAMSCGLVMKEDITQRAIRLIRSVPVVVW